MDKILAADEERGDHGELRSVKATSPYVVYDEQASPDEQALRDKNTTVVIGP